MLCCTEHNKFLCNRETAHRSLLLPPPFPGNCGLTADLSLPTDASDAVYGAHATLFAEELGLVLEVKAAEADAITAMYTGAGVQATLIGKVTAACDWKYCH